MSKRVIRIILVVIIIFAVISTVMYLMRPSVKTVEMINSLYEDKIPFKGIYFTQEYVLYSGEITNSKLKVKDGEKVPSGIPLYDDIRATEAGILSTRIDGYENDFNIDNILSLNEKQLNKIIKNDNTKEGIKVINNSEWYIYGMVDKDTNFKKGRGYDIIINNDSYQGIVKRTTSSNGANFVLFDIKNDLNILSLHRGINGYIIKSRYSGTVVPEEAVVEVNGRKGVFIKTHGYAEFRDAKIVFENKDAAVILPAEKGKLLQDYDDIICNPSGINDGTKIR